MHICFSDIDFRLFYLRGVQNGGGNAVFEKRRTEVLTVITARAGDGKTGAVTDLIGKRMAQGLPSVLIVPDQITYAAERRLCKELDIEGFSLCRVMSFNRFCEAVLRSAGRRCPPIHR